MISTSDTIIFEADSPVLYDSPDIVCFVHYDPDGDVVEARLSVRDSTVAEKSRLAEYTVTLSVSTVNSQSVIASTHVEKWMEAVQEAIVDHLEGLNPGATFSIS